MLEDSSSYLSVFESQFHKERDALIDALPVLFLAFLGHYFHGICTGFAYYLHIPREPLFDVGFEYFSLPTLTTDIISFFLRFAIYSITLGFLISRLFIRSKWSLATILTKSCTALVLSELLRVITFLSTLFPSPHSHCRPDSPYYSPPTIYQIFAPWSYSSVFSLFPSTTCGDSVFSAHVMGFVICSFIIIWYSKSAFLKLIIVILSMAASLNLVILRVDYSLDVFVAWFATTLTWLAYDIYHPDPRTKY